MENENLTQSTVENVATDVAAETTQQVTSDEGTKTQDTPVPEENTSESNVTENPTEPVENADNNPPQEEGSNQTQPVDTKELDELRARLKEYELRDNEIKELGQRLGTDKAGDVKILQARTQLDILNNQATQEYINLCNYYGVDYRPDKIEASAQELLKNSPEAFVQLQFKLNKLNEDTTSKRTEIQNYIHQAERTNALAQYKDVLNASQAMGTAMNMFLDSGLVDSPTEAVTEFMNMATPIYREAFEYGRAYAMQQAEQAKQANPATVLNNNSIAQNATYTATAPKSFTPDDIANMSLEDFKRYETEINKLL